LRFNASGRIDRSTVLNLLLFGLHLAVPRKRRTRIGLRFADPFTQHVLVQVQVAGCLRNRHSSIADQLHRLELELSAELPSLHLRPPVPKTPYLSVHETGSSSIRQAVLSVGLLQSVRAGIGTS
jgi:hypothetical protein